MVRRRALVLWQESSSRPAPRGQPAARPLYTPTLNGFERVLCEMVDLEGEAREGGQCIAKTKYC